jgi:coenzyme F420-reducing hydrogenase delta subunit/ferredoxin
MCSGRVDLEFILRAFYNGQDGVFVGGCKLGECNYVTHGNFDALNTVRLCQKIMEYIGLNPERLRIDFMSGADGILMAQITNEFTDRIKELGPLGKSEGLDQEELKHKLAHVRKLIPYIKLVKKEKLGLHLDDAKAYDDLYTTGEIEKLFNEVVSYYIDPDKCRACMICARKCPVDAIDGAKNTIHVIDQDICIKCGTCFKACPPRFSAVTEICGSPVPPPVAEDKRNIVKKART